MVEIGNSEPRWLAALILIEQDDPHRVSLLDSQGRVGLVVDGAAAPEEAVMAVPGGEVRLAVIRSHLRAAYEGEGIDPRSGGQCQVRWRQRATRKQS